MRDESTETVTDEQIGGDGVAAPDENAKLEGSTPDAPETTRDDLHDAGVPMLQGDSDEPVGPEDALGAGDKRGDYRERVPGNPHTTVALEGGGEPVYRNAETGEPAEAGDPDAVVVDFKPTSALVSQKARTEEIGQAGALKGGVETDPASPAGDAARRAQTA